MHSRTREFSNQPADASASAVDGPSSSLIYEPFYGLREKPFSLSADPRFLFRSPAHGPAFDEILAGIRRREGLIALTGEIGTGKTTLCRSVLQHLDRRTFAAFVADPFVSREHLLKTLLVDFGVISVGEVTRGRFSSASRSDLSFLLYEFLDSLVPLQAFAVLIIDEAQNLSLPLLEEIRILSELERREKLLQVVLVGQPELRANMKLPQMRQVDQRVSVRCELKELDVEGVAGYVNHRLLVAGCAKRSVEFTRAALETVHQGSSGVPRLINRICDRALQHAYLSRSRQIDIQFVRAALDDFGLDVPTPVEEPSPRASWQPLSAAPAPVPAAVAATATVAQSYIAFGSELDFDDAPGAGADSDYSQPSYTSSKRSAARNRWMVWAAALVLASAAAGGAAAWYAGGRAEDGQAVTLPSPPARDATSAAVRVATVDPSLLQPSERSDAGHASPETPASPPAVASRAAAATAADPGARVTYTILVASFKRAESAARVVDELTNAGFGARAVESDGGLQRGPLRLVMVSGYTSAIDAEHDLQQIRQLPGGYADARILEHE
jgi:type II secretory pathway predicted ATPase ExeA/cell division septation protein DedD